MRAMGIPPFPRQIEILDLENFIRTRLSQPVVLWPDQAIPLVGYMGWPNDPAARGKAETILRRWPEGSSMVPPRLGRIQHEWLRVADVTHLHYDIAQGGHQTRRGGASIGKAIALAAAITRSTGTGVATFWTYWKIYKDVAHLVTAAALICAEARARGQVGPFGLDLHQFLPFQMVMLMPDLVLAVGLEFERNGLNFVPHARTKPMLSPETLWCIPPDVNVLPLAPPARKIRKQDVATLNARRAGNRGKAKRRKTTLVFR
jgi:hypothetical protein